jgi:hypothetical protein
MPDRIDDPVLGRLTWDADFAWWTGEVEFRPGQKIGLVAGADPPGGDRARPLAQAREWLDRLRGREPEYRASVARQLARLRLDGQRPMTADDVAALIRVASVETFPDGSAEVCWEDDEVLFGGHGIVTRIDASGACGKVEIQ